MFPNLKLESSLQIKDPHTLYDQRTIHKYPNNQFQTNANNAKVYNYDKFSKSKSKLINSDQKPNIYGSIDNFSDRKNLIQKKKSEKRLWSKKKMDALNERLELQNLRNDKKLNSLLKQLQKLWQNQNISDFYCYYFINQTKNTLQENLQQVLLKQIKMVKNKQSFYHKIIKNIQARQTSIIEIKKFAQILNILYQKSLLQHNDDEFNTKLKSLVEKIRHYRKLTVYIVDKIAEWRQYLLNISQTQSQSYNLIFFYQNQNYLLKIINDAGFFQFTFLAQYLEFAQQNDPFLIKPLKNSINQNSKKFRQLFEIDNTLKDKILKALDYLAKEKGYFNSQKIIKNSLNQKSKSTHKYSNTEMKGLRQQFQGLQRRQIRLAKQYEKLNKQRSEQKQYDFNDKQSIKQIIENYKNIKGQSKKVDFLKTNMNAQTLNKINQTAEKYEKFIKKKVPLKQNSDLISELRSQIIQKLRKQKTAKNQNFTQQEQNTIEKLKFKMKKEFQMKIKQQKNKKYIEKGILQRKLKEEQIKLINNRQLQISLKIKLNREKDAVEILNIKKKYQDAKKSLESKSKLNQQDQQKIKQQIKLLSIKQNQQLEKFQKQRTKRDSILKQKMMIQQKKRKQLQSQLEQNRQNEYKIYLDQYKNQRKLMEPAPRNELQDQIYRDKIKSKLEKQLRIQLIQRSKKQLQDTQLKKYEIKSQLQKSQKNLKNEINKPLDRHRIQNQVKKQILEKAILERKLDSEMAKKQLREQFEKQLLGNTNTNFSYKTEDFLIKNLHAYKQQIYQKIKLDENKQNQRENEIQGQNIENKNQQVLQIKKFNQPKQANPILDQLSKKADNLGMSPENYQLYLKKKKNFILNTQQNKVQEDLRLFTANNNNIQDQNEYVKVKVQRKPESIKKNQYEEDNFRKTDSKTRKSKKRLKKREESRQSKSQEESEKQVSITKKKRNNEQNKNAQNEGQKRSTIKSNKMRKTSQQDSPIKAIGQFQTTNFPQQTIKSKFKINLEAIDQFELEQYINNHILQIPKQQLDISPYSKEEIYQKLLEQLTFSLLIGKHEQKKIGLCIAHHDRNHLKSRKFILTHIGTYKTKDHFDFILDICNYIFRKDPCDEIQFMFKVDQQNPQQLNLCTNFNDKFDKYGIIFQKLLQNEVYERKYVMKRPFNLKCQIKLGSSNKNSFVNLFSVTASVIFSNLQLFQNKQQVMISRNNFPERQISYSVMMSQIFRNSLTAEQAENLKLKVKQNLKLKELLVLVVMLEKKKIKLEELKLLEAKTISQINLKLLSQGRQLIKMVKDAEGTFNKISNCEVNQSYKLPFHFQTATLPLEFKENIKHINYFRLSPLNPHKTYIIKSSLYNAEMHVLPTQNPKFKLFVMMASQFNQIKDQNQIDLFMYIRVFLKNVKSHNVSNWKYLWIPEITTKQYWSIKQFRPFLDKDIYIYDSINISYRQFIPGALIIQPEHKDLVVTPPFIVGILSISLEQVSEGSPLYARYIDAGSLKAVQTQSKQI